MVSKIVVGLLVAAALAVGMLIEGTRAPDAAPERTAGRSLPASRLFALLPDGRVELTDAWARRVFRWDGRRWLEVEVPRLAATDPR